MWARLSIVLGLVAGVVAAAVLLGGILVLAPEPVPSPTPVPTVLPSAAPTPSPSPAPSASATLSPSASASAALFHVGEPAPALVVPQVGGGTIDLASLKGRPVWVNFMGTYCPPCRDEFPLMNGFAARFAEEDDGGLVVLAIDVKEDEGIVAAFAQELETTFPMGLDADGSVAATWDAIALPVHFWIDAEGVIRDGALGGIGPDIMARGLSTILGQPVEP